MVERGIGRGLAAILPPSQPDEQRLQQVPVDLIEPNPRQPRRSLDGDDLRELGESIKSRGVLQPVLVRPLVGGRYELIVGERRWRAARMAGLERLPAVVRASEDAERLELALIENMAREDLSPVEAASGCAALVDELGLSKEEVGRRVGRSRVAVSNLIRLLDLPDDVLAMIDSGELSEGHGRALLQARDPRTQRALAREVRDRGLSVRETEAMARSAGSGGSGADRDVRAVEHPDIEVAREEAEELLSTALGREVRVRLGRRGARVEIPFDGLRDVGDFARQLSERLAA